MYKLIIKPFAEEDARHAANWYNERREGLGNEFLFALEAALNAIQRNPNQYQVAYKELRRALTVITSYSIHYTKLYDTWGRHPGPLDVVTADSPSWRRSPCLRWA